MEDLFSEIGKGFLRGIGYILAEVFFGSICFWVGWPICKIVTLGKYPYSGQTIYYGDTDNRHEGFWCSLVGLIVLIFGGLYFTGQFSSA